LERKGSGREGLYTAAVHQAARPESVHPSNGRVGPRRILVQGRARAAAPSAERLEPAAASALDGPNCETLSAYEQGVKADDYQLDQWSGQRAAYVNGNANTQWRPYFRH